MIILNFFSYFLLRDPEDLRQSNYDFRKTCFPLQMSACGLISHAMAIGSPEFTVELWMVIAAPQRLV